MSKEKYNQIVDKVYGKFITEANSIKEGYENGEILGSQQHIDDMFSNPDELIILTKEGFVEKCENNEEFSKRWGYVKTNVISLEDLKDFDTWKKWKHGEVKLEQPELTQLSASWAKSREQTRETAMHIGFASGFMSGLECYEDFYDELNRTQLGEDEFTRNYIVDRFEETYGGK
jgi:hypothetical protein